MKVRLTARGAAIVGGSWLLALWAHVALPGTVAFALALVVLSGAAGWLARRPTPLAVAAADGPAAIGCHPESASLRGMRAELRGLEAELHALVDQERTGPVAAGDPWRAPGPLAVGGPILARRSTG